MIGIVDNTRNVRHTNMVDILFYTTVSILCLIAPIFLRVAGSFSLDRKVACITMRLFFLKVLTIRLYFHEDGVMISLNGKQGKPITVKREDRKKRGIFHPYIQMIRIKEIDLNVYASGEPSALSLSLSSILSAITAFLEYLKGIRLLDRSKVTILPSYISDQTTVNFSISFFTSPAQILAALVHTKEGKGLWKKKRSEI